jgi:hypothetical protein
MHKRKTERLDSQGFFHMEFYLRELLNAGADGQFIRETFNLMDRIDDVRNQMVRLLNSVFDPAVGRLAPIVKSSDLVRMSKRDIGKNDWGRYYIRTWERLLPIIDGEGPDESRARSDDLPLATGEHS